jgi:nicotinamidase-related amidase
MRILKEDVVALVIDIQEKLHPHMADNEQLLSKSTRLLEGFKTLGVPVLFTEQYPKGLGATLSEISGIFEDFKAYAKLSFSCLDVPEIAEELKKSGRKTVVVIGMEAHVCVMQTCVDLKATGYQPVIIEDCVSSHKLEDKANGLKRLEQEGVTTSCFESILFELTRAAGSDTFKVISKLVK